MGDVASYVSTANTGREISERFQSGPLARANSLKTSVGHGIDRHAQGAVIVIAESDEAEGLQRSLAGSSNWGEHFGHASDRATLQMKGNFDEIALSEGPGKAQQAASNGNGLKFSFGALTVFQHDECGNGTTNLDTRRAALRVHLGEVSHGHPLSHGPVAADRLRKAQAPSKNLQSTKSLPIKRMGLSVVFS